jgi:hypothetical protein
MPSSTYTSADAAERIRASFADAMPGRKGARARGRHRNLRRAPPAHRRGAALVSRSGHLDYPALVEADIARGLAWRAPEGCLEWRGRGIWNGYGLRKIGGRKGKLRLVHRDAWARANGAIPDGLCIDHVCRNRRCYELAHLRLVTPRQNTLENSNSLQARYASRTHCSRGHEFTPENTRWRQDGNRARPVRACRKCSNNGGALRRGTQCAR